MPISRMGKGRKSSSMYGEDDSFSMDVPMVKTMGTMKKMMGEAGSLSMADRRAAKVAAPIKTTVKREAGNLTDEDRSRFRSKNRGRRR